VVSGALVSTQVAAPRTEVWEALLHPAARTDGPDGSTVLHRIALGGTVLDLDVVDPVDGLTGTAVWAGVPHHVAAHLIDLGGDRTLLVVTADEAVQGAEHRLGVGDRGAHVQRHVQRGLHLLVDDVQRRSTATLTAR
jgi:hypothetical protein